MKIVVVGGVAAGMSIAARARRLDEHADIVVFERGHHVSFANCGLPYHIGNTIKDRGRLLLQTPQSLRESLDIDVRTGVEVLAIDRAAKTVRARVLDTAEEYDEPYDKLALAPGAEPLRPPLPGVDLPSVHVLRRIGDMDVIKRAVDGDGDAGRTGGIEHAVVIGAGYIGLEMAENLRERGVAVAVVEMADQIVPALDHEMTTSVENHIRSRGVTLHLRTAAAAFSVRPNGRTQVELRNNTFIETDMVILAAGVRPCTELAADAGLDLGPRGGIAVDEHMRTSDPSIWAAGDAVEVRHTVLPGSWLIPLAGPANRQGRVAAENMCGRDTTFESVQGTSIVKAFDMVAGGTGASERQLRAAGIPYRAVNTHPHGHAGYYPGTAMMHLKLLFSPEDGRILGAQAVGFDGVDKRLDVLATALRGGMTVYDLEHLELAYAPPFGSAKDPVNMAGFMASNLLRGDLELWYADEYPEAMEGARIIDVRGPDEFALWHLPGAENVPLTSLRSAQEDWDRGTPIRLYCAVGFRSYLAYRALVQRGFSDVRTLSGGMATFRAFHDATPSEVDSHTPMISYAEDTSLPTPARAATGITVDLDCTGLACPGPIMKLQRAIDELRPGDEILVHVSDPGFRLDAPAWATRNGHTMVDITPEGPGYAARFRKGGHVLGGAAARIRDKKAFIVFSGEFDKVLAAFIIANGALAMGDEVSMFFTFWGLNTLRRPDSPTRDKAPLDRMFSAMMPSGPDALPLSTMNMLGGGPAMIKKVMRDHNVPSLPELIASAQQGGVRLFACTMTMDLLGIRAEDLIDGVELGGVATFLGEANESNGRFFI
jgi:NADPH-dependent 2,4-dienoyl-CoA reductase/sulfur reductase-like enzyme/peroxiredoxin family protein/TusA-related sulfurtransferase/rhodanese-related sulfurtransferase